MIPINDHVLDHVDAYLHGVLTRAEAATVERHCAKCPICKVAMEEARKRFTAMRALPVLEPPEELISATQGKIAEAPKFVFTRAAAGLAVAAAAALILACVHIYYATLSPSPYDLRVLGQNELLAGSEASLRVLLVDHETNRPVEGVPVEIELLGTDSGKRIHLASFTTDQFGSGTPQLTLPDWKDGEYRLQVRAKPGRTAEVIHRTVSLKRSWQLMLSTDKPVYQPGQTIRVRSLGLRRPDLKPVAGHEAVFSVTDPKGNVIFRRREVTSRFGIASTDCPLATEILTGPYQIECKLGDTATTVTVEVKKYVLPKFKIAIKLDEPYYEPGQMVRGTVQTDYFFGKPVEHGEIEVDVQTADVWKVQFEQITARTDAEGTADFQFRVPDSLFGREQLEGDAEIAVKVTVRDGAGQKESKTVRRIVTAQPIRVEVIPEGGSLVRDVPNTVYLFTSYPDGQPAKTRIAVTGIERELVTNDYGVVSIELTPEGDEVAWIVRATDDEGRIGRREVTLRCGPPTGDFLVRTDKAVYDGGETMHVLALGAGVEPVFIDLIKDGQTMLTDVIEMKSGPGEYQFDLPPGLFGTVELYAYRYNESGLPVGKRRAIYVRQARSVEIETALDKKEYRPGEQAKLTFKLTGKGGKPAPGALSLAAVDEAVFSVLPQRPGMQQAFFTLEEKILKPIYAVYPWSPNLKTSLPDDEQERFEQAMFAMTAEEGRDSRTILAEVIRDFGENDQRLLRVLDHPDLDRLMEYMELPAEIKSLLRNQSSVHTLCVTSFPAKAQAIAAHRKAGMRFCKVTWIVSAVIVGIVILVVLMRKMVEILVLITIIGLLAALMLPAVQAARESARRASALNDLKQLDLALQNYQTVLGEFPGQTSQESESGAPAPRVRQWFPETLLWRPELITDDDGRASIEVDLADSITTWRLSASAVTAEGNLGADEAAIRVFQPFFVDLNLPVALTRGDEVAVPVVVYNYLDGPQTVELTLADAPWFKRLGEPVQKLELEPNEVRSVSYRIRAKKVGKYELQVDALGGDVADAIKREIEVLPDGRRVERVENGTLQQPAEMEFDVPDNAIEGSVKTIVRIYPSSFSQLVEGLDAIFQRPYGCFEQTSSVTYPNVLALDYLRRTNKSVPSVEAAARQYIHLGYQRLLGFEVAGGGFDWFGRPPANRTLTAYGLMEFEDMARVHDVDPALIERTRQWLLEEQRADGSWSNEKGMLDDGLAGSVYRGGHKNLLATAYIGWAVFANNPSNPMARRTLDFLLSHDAASIENPYVLALVSNALAAIDSTGRAARPYIEQLEAVKRMSPDGKLVWWELRDRGRTTFYGAGRSGNIETTALAALAMIRTGHAPATARGALAWLADQKDALGTWHSTQATVLALKALLAGTGKPFGGQKPRRIDVALDGKKVRQLTIPADQGDVVQQINLSKEVAGGKHRLKLTDRTGTAVGYQVAFAYYVPDKGEPAGQQPLAIDLRYDRTELTQRETITATATVTNNMATAAPMVILDLPIPAGFAVEADDFSKLVEEGKIAKYQVTARSVVVYLRRLPPTEPLQRCYRLRATMPVKVTAQPAAAYEYYDPDRRAQSPATRLTVAPAVNR